MDVASLDLASVDHVLTTTRAVRKRLDLTRPVEPAILEQCLGIALQAPIGLSGETRHFVVVTDPEPRAAIAALYRRAAAEAGSGTRPRDPYLAKLQISDATDPHFAQQQRMFASGAHLVQHLHEVPVLVLACIEGRVLRSGEHLVPEAALEALADQNIPFTVKGKTTYEQQMAAIRGAATPPVQ